MRKNRDGINKNYYGGMLIVLFGLAVAATATKYGIGSLRDMGSGFFPALVGALLVLTGIAITVQGLGGGGATIHNEKPQWRGWLCILGGIVAFIILGKHTGLLPATFAIVFITAIGDRKNSIKAALVLAVAMSIVAAVVFWWLLQLQFPLLIWNPA